MSPRPGDPPITRATAVDRAERAIDAAYRAWEDGLLPSPSPSDLIAQAYDAISGGAGIPREEREPLAEQLFAAQESLDGSRAQAEFIVTLIEGTRYSRHVIR